MLVTIAKFARKSALVFVLATFLTVSPAALMAAMSSTNYVIPSDTISVGGNLSTSASWIANDTIGEPATGEDLTSASYAACAGYQCFRSEPFVSFSVKEGTAAPGTAGANVDFGTLTTGAVASSGISSVNSIFVTAESNASQGMSVTVTGANGALKSIGTPSSTIPSSTASLVAGTAGFGVCVFSNTQDVDSPSSFAKQAPYASTCDKSTGHDVGQVQTSPQQILSSSAELKGGAAELLVKAAISITTPGRSDYAETLTFIATGTY